MPGTDAMQRRRQRNLAQNKLNTIHYGSSPFDHHQPHPHPFQPRPIPFASSCFTILRRLFILLALAHKRSVEGGGGVEKLRIGNSLKLPLPPFLFHLSLPAPFSFFLSLRLKRRNHFYGLGLSSIWIQPVKGVGIGKRCGL